METKPIPLDALTPDEQAAIIRIAMKFGISNLRSFRFYSDVSGHVLIPSPRDGNGREYKTT